MKAKDLRKRLVSKKLIPLCSIVLLLALVLGSSKTAFSQGVDDSAVVRMVVTRRGIRWEPLVEHGGIELAVSGPGGIVLSRTFGPNEVPTFTLAGASGDGSYTYELRVLPADGTAPEKVDDEQRGVVDAGDSEAMVLSGGFAIHDGRFVIPTEEGEAESLGAADAALAPDGQVIANDLIVQGSLCVGVDCISSESFGFDTQRLKENNLRIHFQDTSSTASFPTNDWRITINDSSNGGASYFSIDDASSGRQVFKIEAGTRANALYVDDSGRVGLGTSTPAVNLHIWYGDTPTVRLHQSGSGWAPQTWDMAGNEVNFFIRDVTNGSKLPFRIEPNTPGDTLSLKSSGNVGIGTWSPAFPIEVERTGANAQILFDRTDGAEAIFGALIDKARFGSRTNHPVNIIVNNTGVATFETNGDLTMTNGDVNANAFNPTSDVNAKENFATVDGKEVLAQLEGVEITTWNFKGDDVRHIGPTAQDFYAAYGLGVDDKRISTTDADGVALAAIKALNAQNKALEEENAELEARVTALEQAAGLSSEPQVSFVTLLPWILVGVLLVGLGMMGGFVLATRKQFVRTNN